MRSLSAAAFAFLAATVTGLSTQQANCNAISSNFQMVANISGELMYNVINSFCLYGKCGSFFDIDQAHSSTNYTVFSIGDDNRLTVVASQNPPSEGPNGFVGYYHGTPHFVMYDPPNLIRLDRRPLNCTLQADGEGSCDVICKGFKVDKHGNEKKFIADFYEPPNGNRWCIGKRKPYVKIAVKAIASQFPERSIESDGVRNAVDVRVGGENVNCIDLLNMS